MDDKLKVEFPVGDLKIVVSEPTEGQQFALALSRTSSDGDRTRLVQRLLRVLESLVGPEQWYDVIETALIEGAMSPEQLVKLGGDVVSFPWHKHRKPVDVPAPDLEGIPATGNAAGPRVVSGG